MRTIENGRLFNILQVIIGCLISLIYNKTIKCRLEIIYIEKTSSFLVDSWVCTIPYESTFRYVRRIELPSCHWLHRVSPFGNYLSRSG